MKKTEFGGFLIRIVVGVTFLFHGLAKYQEGINVVQAQFFSYNIPYSDYVAIAVTFIEILGGVAIIIGFTTRFIAALFIGIMIGAIVFVKFELGFLHGYEIDVLLLAMSSYLLFAGNKFLALDNFFVERKKKKA